jgi:DNA polymerase-3 subunit alpha
MTNFLQDFKPYKDCVPPGVRLPSIEIEDKYYKALGVSSDISTYDFLRKLCLQGVKDREIDTKTKSEQEAYYSRAKMELEVLRDLGFIDYILLNWDILNFCHENDIPTGPGRGSAAGSLVLFLIGVTQIDPIKYDLFFERFVSQSRSRKIEKNNITYLDGSLLADIDNDISYERRKEVIQYIEQKYPGRTAKILTLNTLSSKLCIKECGKIVGEYSEQDVNEVSDMILKKFGRPAPLLEALEESEKLRDWKESNVEVFQVARKLEGLNKNTGVHPSGIAISHDKIEDYCPLQKTADDGLVTAYDMNWVAELMVKFDILGLRTLSVIYDVCKALDLDIYDVDLSDPKVYQPLRELRCPHGLFQIEADANYRVCKKIKPRTLEELSAVVALARPGALDFVDSYLEYVETGELQVVHSFFEDVLDYTGGIPLYQEQLMKMAVKVGFTLDESEQLRRIIGKKKVDKMPEWEAKIEEKIASNKLDPDIGKVLWSVAEDSANYSFNKSHANSYATLSAWTTYLKFKYPQQFFLSLLKMSKFEPAPHEEISKISQELPFFNIRLLPPDLARSSMDFNIEGANIRFGLNSIKGVSEKSLQALREFRDSETPTKFDIFLAAKQAGLNIGILSALIQAGALSSYKSNRSLLVLEAQAFNILTDREKRNVLQLGEQYDHKLLSIIADARDGKLVGDDGRLLMTEKRFGTFRKKYQPYKEIYEKNKKYESFANWYFENKLLGYSPSCSLKEVFSGSDPRLNNSLYFESMDLNSSAKFIGTVEDAYKKKSQNGNLYIKIMLSDELGRIPCLLMDTRRRDGSRPALTRFLEKNKSAPEKGNILMVRGRKGDEVVFLEDVEVLDQKIYMKLGDLK